MFRNGKQCCIFNVFDECNVSNKLKEVNYKKEVLGSLPTLMTIPG